MFQWFGTKAFLPSGPVLKLMSRLLCDQTKWEEDLCENIFFLLSGSDPANFNEVCSYVYTCYKHCRNVYHNTQIMKKDLLSSITSHESSAVVFISSNSSIIYAGNGASHYNPYSSRNIHVYHNSLHARIFHRYMFTCFFSPFMPAISSKTALMVLDGKIKPYPLSFKQQLKDTLAWIGAPNKTWRSTDSQHPRPITWRKWPHPSSSTGAKMTG